MAGVKGKSGGARPNSGGARVGAGRKPKVKAAPIVIPLDLGNAVPGEPFDPRPVVEQIALGLLEVPPQQFKALTLLMPYSHGKRGDGGKKEEKEGAAKKAGLGKFAPSAPPSLKVVKNGGR
ncbi:MAG: hypothetical protein ACRYGK_01690 [Janthinobacterium lividum]